MPGQLHEGKVSAIYPFIREVS